MALLIIGMASGTVRAQWSQTFAFGLGLCKLETSQSPSMHQKRSSYFAPTLALGLEYHFQAPISLSLRPTYSFTRLAEIYNRPTHYYYYYGSTYVYYFNVHTLNFPIMINYYTHADDEKSWIFSLGGGLSLISNLQSRATTTVFFGPISSSKDTVYEVKEFTPGNLNTIVCASIAKKFKTKKRIKPYLRISYLTNTSYWRFPAYYADTRYFFARPHFMSFELGFTIKSQAVKVPPGDQTILQGQ